MEGAEAVQELKNSMRARTGKCYIVLRTPSL